MTLFTNKSRLYFRTLNRFTKPLPASFCCLSGFPCKCKSNLTTGIFSLNSHHDASKYSILEQYHNNIKNQNRRSWIVEGVTTSLPQVTSYRKGSCSFLSRFSCRGRNPNPFPEHLLTRSTLASPPQSSSLSSSPLVCYSPIYLCRHSIFPIRAIHTSTTMAKSKFEYVKQFETDDPCLPNCWLVVRIDGKAFHKFTDSHHYMKPNDERGLGLMTRAAQNVMSEFNEVVLAYGQSDEYSFVFHKNCKLYNRRASKIMTNVVSLFSSSFTLFWSRFFNTQELQYPPSFDARVVLYPSDDNIKDYLSWRQADCHINNLYNTCFWKLVQEKGLTPSSAQEKLKGTLSSDKNEILFSEFNTNYNSLPELYRKGTVLIRPRDVEFANDVDAQVKNSVGFTGGPQKSKGKNQKPSSVVLHCDIIGKQFWEEHPYVLTSKRPV